VAACEKALTGLEAHRRLAPTATERRHLAGQAASIAARLTASLLRLGRPRKALEATESARAVTLREDQARAGRVPAGLTPREADEYCRLSGELREADYQRRRLEREGDQAAIAALYGALSGKMARLHELEAQDPTFALRPPDYPALRELARRLGGQAALVYLQVTADAALGSVAFVVHAGSPADGPAPEDVIPASTCGEKKVNAWLGETPPPVESWVDRFNARQRAVRTLAEALAVGNAQVVAGAAAGWATAEAKWQEALTEMDKAKRDGQAGWLVAYQLAQVARPTAAGQAAQEPWQATMERVLREVGEMLLAPLAARLKELGLGQVYLIPGGLGLLPLHAAFTGKEDSRCYFGELFQVAYAPSAAVLERCLGRVAPVKAPTLVAVANPDGSLAFADEAVEAIAARFKDRAQVRHGPAATKAWLLAQAPTADYLELSTHGSFVLDDPLSSRLLLAPPAPALPGSPEGIRRLAGPAAAEAQLTLEELLAGRVALKEGCVASLDACETSLVDPRGRGEESLGLPAGFLLAGAAAVVGSLWAVDDLSTAFLMEHLYDEMLTGRRPAVALQAAQRRIRTLPKAEVLARIDRRLAELAGQRDPRSRAHQRLLLRRRADIADDPAACPFAHPYWWAAFAAYGV
jgi:CHAT domain-containing protein